PRQPAQAGFAPLAEGFSPTAPPARAGGLRTAQGVAPGVPVFIVSAKTGEGIEDLRRYFNAGETLGVLGKSGVGKSALIRALGFEAAASADDDVKRYHPLFTADEESLREGAVREKDRKGRHTTTSSRLYPLASGFLIIDSPGIRELKIWGEQEDIADAFPEIAELAAQCRFSDCSHMQEPGCAVRNALEHGVLDEARFQSYVALLKEQKWLERRIDDQAMRAEKARWKQIAKFQKNLQKYGR
ncbi:MAG: GTPase RsgA, partial [Termitinemataceae bacterium]